MKLLEDLLDDIKVQKPFGERGLRDWHQKIFVSQMLSGGDAN